jgi:hypothetical protein
MFNIEHQAAWITVINWILLALLNLIDGSAMSGLYVKGQQIISTTARGATQVSRIKIGTSSNAIFSGPLRDVLKHHVKEKARHYFLFGKYVQITCDYLSGIDKIKASSLTLDNAIQKTATHQVGKGSYDAKYYKGDDGEYPGSSQSRFDVKAIDILNRQSTGQIDTVAAHYNNLGLSPKFVNIMQEMIGEHPDRKVLKKLNEICIALCAGTSILPKEINLGPEKIMDRLQREHYEYFQKSGGALLSQESIDSYVDKGTAQISNWGGRNHKGTEIGQLMEPYKAGLAETRIILYPQAMRSIEYFLQDMIEAEDFTLGSSLQDLSDRYLQETESGNKGIRVPRPESVQKLIDEFQVERRINSGALLGPGSTSSSDPLQ